VLLMLLCVGLRRSMLLIGLLVWLLLLLRLILMTVCLAA
jgi:hypothetical protein